LLSRFRSADPRDLHPFPTRRSSDLPRRTLARRTGMTSPTTAGRAEPHAGADPLRNVLQIDGWSTLLFGIALLGTAPWLSGPLGIPASWLVPFGVVMLG